MNRRAFLLLGAAGSGLILLASTDNAVASKPTTSRLTVHVLSVERKSSNIVTFTGGGSRETTAFVAKAQIEKVLATDCGLSAGATIEIRYDVVVSLPKPGYRDTPTLTAGETTTITVAGDANRLQWLR